MKTVKCTLVSVALILLAGLGRCFADDSAPPMPPRVGFPVESYKFTDTNWNSSLGYAPRSFSGIEGVTGWSTNLAMRIIGTGPAWLQYNYVDGDTNSARTNLTFPEGALSFWVRPLTWSSTNIEGGTGPRAPARLLELGAYSEQGNWGWFSLFLDEAGTVLSVGVQSNGVTAVPIQASISWASNEWHMVACNYTLTNIELFVDGQLAASATNGLPCWPSDGVLLTNGVFIGSDSSGYNLANADFEYLRIYDYAMPGNSFDAQYNKVLTNYIQGAGTNGFQSIALDDMEGDTAVTLHLDSVNSQTNTLRLQGAATNTIWDIYFSSILVSNATPWTIYYHGTNNQFNFTVPNPDGTMGLFAAGSAADTDNDGLSDGYECLVSRTETNVPNYPRDIYEMAISNQSPDHWFKINDSSFADTGTNGGPALTNSGAYFTNDLFDKVNGAVAFDNNSNVLTAGDLINGGNSLYPTNSGSVSLLFRTLGALTTSKRYLLSQGTSSTSSKNAFHVYFDNTAGGQDLKLQLGNTNTSILPTNEIVFNTWYYLAITWKEDRNPEVNWYLGRVRGLINSGSIDLLDTTSTHAVVGDNGSLYLGNKSGGGNAFRETGDGALDQVAFWNRELTEAEVMKQFNALPPAWLPANFNWELMLPVNSAGQLGGTDPHVVGRSQLNAGFKYLDPTNCTKKYFYMGTGGTMVFETPWNGADTDTSSNSPRSELRETLANGNEYNWKPYDPATGIATNTHTLQAVCRLESGASKVIIGQIHAETPNTGTAPADGVPAITLYHEGLGSSSNRIRMAVYYSPDNSVTNAGSTDQTYTLVSGVNAGVRIDYQLTLVGTSNSAVTLTATLATNGTPVTPKAVNMTSDPGFSGWGATNVTLYFKAGCYSPKAANNSGSAKVTFSSLAATHQP